MSQTLSTENLIIMQYSGVYSTDRKTNATKEWTISLGTVGISLLDSLGCPGCVGYFFGGCCSFVFLCSYAGIHKPVPYKQDLE